ncbi:DUF5943 domain-containing protein [Acuticoccus kandeliae]|uniref:DUF5943 domain-containing protein n=1 Tax=Acuticoccus kandeliae TaxID=2073160 RepID=UPI000D3E9CE7|nr:DUF5943 domain-containing protein [Acuticoccus kandeliae]
MTAPQVPIAVDPKTGIWTTDGLPMIYLPRHFYVNHRDMFEAAFGAEAVAKVFWDAGYASAWQWCEKESATHGLSGLDVFRHYMKRLSQRGWGRFTVLDVDAETGAARVALDHSIYAEHRGTAAGGRACGPFASWIVGSLEWAGRDMGRPWHLTAEETACACEGAPRCLFTARPKDA